jgi:hypothetical protein
LDPRSSEIERLIDGKTETSIASLEASSRVSLLLDKINEEATAHPGKAYNQKTLKLYAVRANAEQMLDVARGTFKENVDDIHKREWDQRSNRSALLNDRGISER